MATKLTFKIDNKTNKIDIPLVYFITLLFDNNILFN